MYSRAVFSKHVKQKQTFNIKKEKKIVQYWIIIVKVEAYEIYYFTFNGVNVVKFCRHNFEVNEVPTRKGSLENYYELSIAVTGGINFNVK